MVVFVDYKEILNSRYFIKTYSKIEKKKKNFYVNHGFVHINNVLKNAERLVDVFSLTEREKNMLFVACLLHDIGYLKNRDNHAFYGAVLARKYLKNKAFCKHCVEKICDAISSHGGKNESDYDDVVSRCLIIADKLDFVSSRYNENLLEDENKRKIFLNVVDTFLKYKDNCVSLCIVISKNFDKVLFENSKYYLKLVSFLELLCKKLTCGYCIKYIMDSE